eukprot:7711568-Alexandrium_andersonii.AAC.1
MGRWLRPRPLPEGPRLPLRPTTTFSGTGTAGVRSSSPSGRPSRPPSARSRPRRACAATCLSPPLPLAQPV